MKIPAIEFIGTYFLVLVVGCVSLQGAAGPVAAAAIAAVLVAMIYVGGHISGAHYNPAVTIAFIVRGTCTWKDILPYWLAQLTAAAVASATCCLLFNEAMAEPSALKTVDRIPLVFVAEFLFTFALCFVILCVATASKLQPNQFYAVAIAAVVLTGILSVGTISGAVFNPAVAIGGAAMGLLGWTHLWVYFAAQFLAAPVAAYAFLAIHGRE